MIVGGFNDLGKVEIIDPLDNSANFPMTITYPKRHEFEVLSNGQFQFKKTSFWFAILAEKRNVSH